MVWNLVCFFERWGIRALIVYFNYYCIQFISWTPAYLGVEPYGYLGSMLATPMIVAFIALEGLLFCVVFLCTIDYALRSERVLLGEIAGKTLTL